MKTQGVQYWRLVCSCCGVLALWSAVAVGADKVGDQPVFKDFVARVKTYEKLRNSAPHLRPTKEHAEITDRRLNLAESIRAARPDAKQGDIFAAEISAKFVMVIRETLQGTGTTSSNARKTIRQGEPLKELTLQVNGAYPEGMAVTTVPPTLLRRLPELPEKMAYRIIGHDFVLQDTEARLIVDFIPGAIP